MTIYVALWSIYSLAERDMDNLSSKFVQEFCNNLEYYLVREWRQIKHQVYWKKKLYFQEFQDKFLVDTTGAHHVGLVNPIFRYIHQAWITLEWMHMVRALWKWCHTYDWTMDEFLVMGFHNSCSVFDLDRIKELLYSYRKPVSCYSDLISMLYISGSLPRLVALHHNEIQDEMDKRIWNNFISTKEHKEVIEAKTPTV